MEWSCLSNFIKRKAQRTISNVSQFLAVTRVNVYLQHLNSFQLHYQGDKKKNNKRKKKRRVCVCVWVKQIPKSAQHPRNVFRFATVIGTRNRSQTKGGSEKDGKGVAKERDKYSNAVFMKVHRYSGGLIDAKAALFSTVGSTPESGGGTRSVPLSPPFPCSLPVAFLISIVVGASLSSLRRWMHRGRPRRVTVPFAPLQYPCSCNEDRIVDNTGCKEAHQFSNFLNASIKKDTFHDH